MRHLLLILAILASGCATWRQTADQGLGYAHQAGAALRETGGVVIDIRCAAAARKCISDGIVDAEKCSGWVTCNEVRQEVAMGLILLNYAVMDGKLALSVGDQTSAEKSVAKAIEIVAKIREQLREIGLLK